MPRLEPWDRLHVLLSENSSDRLLTHQYDRDKFKDSYDLDAYAQQVISLIGYLRGHQKYRMLRIADFMGLSLSQTYKIAKRKSYIEGATFFAALRRARREFGKHFLEREPAVEQHCQRAMLDSVIWLVEVVLSKKRPRSYPLSVDLLKAMTSLYHSGKLGPGTHGLGDQVEWFTAARRFDCFRDLNATQIIDCLEAWFTPFLIVATREPWQLDESFPGVCRSSR